MNQSVILAGNDRLREIRLTDFASLEEIHLEGASAVGAWGGRVFCASDWGDMIWRLDGKQLLPTGLFGGGPGMSALSVCASGKRLVTLCSEADSLLMLSADSGTPMIICHVGVNPMEFSICMDRREIIVAGGGNGTAHILDADSLREKEAFDMPGITVSAELQGGLLYTLCANETLDTRLVTIDEKQSRTELELDGMPGTLLVADSCLFAATCGNLYAVQKGGTRVIRRWAAPGKAGKMIKVGEKLLYCDTLNEKLYVFHLESGRWRCLAEGVRDICLSE